MNSPGEKGDREKWSKLTEAFTGKTKLTFVRLDRTIVATDADGTESIDTPIKAAAARSVKKPSIDPIDEITRVTTEKYIDYKREVDDIKSKTLDQLLKLHFEQITPTLTRTKTSESQLRIKLSQLRNRVDTSSLFKDSPDLKTSTAKFFDSFENFLFKDKVDDATPRKGRRSLQEESKGLLVSMKERQLEELLRVFENEQEETKKAYSSIKNYLAVTSKFLDESGKQLSFSNNLKLCFTVTAHQEASRDEKSLKELSSGERQVIIVLTYLAFLAGENSIFVIDEPELSLHLRWQAYLVQALKDLRPKNCQIILATHAPEIAGRARQKVRRLPAQGLVKKSEANVI